MKLRVLFIMMLAGILLSGLLSVSGEQKHPFIFKSIPDDADDDGVPDADDACNGVNASFFDRDGDGCIDEVIGARHTEYWDTGDLPFVYYINQDGAPNITDGSDITAVRNGVEAWESILGTDFTITYGGTTAQPDAAGLDGMNLVTFSDPDYQFGQYVLAVGLSYSFTTATEFGGKVYRPGQIIDADMIFNPLKTFKTATQGTYGTDIQSTATHEGGHLFGIAHTAVRSSTMFFILPGGTQASSLADEDENVFVKAYPSAATLADANRIEGTVTDGLTDLPLPGAIVFAINSATDDTVACDYTMPDGSYLVFDLPDGDYYIAVYPLDGTSPIMGLAPGYINDLIDSTATTLFVPEYYTADDDKYDDPSLKDLVSVSGGSTASGIDIMTNIDDEGPTVESITPDDLDTGVRIDAALLISFSEAIDITTIKKNFSVREVGPNTYMKGTASILHDDSLITFTASPPYKFNTTYVCSLKTGLKDKFGNPMADHYVTHFTTEVEPPLSITSLVPSKGVGGSIIVINGQGFDYSSTPDNTVIFPATGGGTPVEAPISQFGPNRLVVTVPPGVQTGSVRVVVGPDTSNGLTFTLLSPVEIARGYEAGVSTLGGVPRSLTVLPDGLYAYAATDKGASSVVVSPGLAGYLNSTDIAISGGLNDVDAIPTGKRVYGVSRADSSIHVICSDPDETQQFNSVINTIFTRDEPLGIIIEPTGRKAYVPTLGGKIQVWDVDQTSVTFWKQIGSITPPDPNLCGKMCIDPSGERLYTLTNTGKVAVYEIGPDTLLWEVTVGSEPFDIVVDPAGQRAYVSNKMGYVSILSLSPAAPPWLVQDITSNGSLRGLTITPGGFYVYAANRQLDAIDVIDLVENSSTFRSVAANIELGANPVDVDLSPEGFYAFSLVENTKQLIATTIGYGPVLKSLSKSAAPGGAKLVLAGEGFGLCNGCIKVSFAGTGGTIIGVAPDQSSFTSLVVTIPTDAVSGAVKVGVKPSDVQGPYQYSNELYLEVLDSLITRKTLRYAAQIPIGSYNYGFPIRVSPVGDQMALRVVAQDLVVLFDIDPDSPTFHQILGVINIYAPTATPLIGDMAFTPDGKRLFVAEQDGSATHVLDVNRHSATYGDKLAQIDTQGARPLYLRVSPNNEYCVVLEDQDMSFIDIIEGSLTEYMIVDTINAAFTLEIGDFEFHPAGNYIYAQANDKIKVIDMNPLSSTFKRAVNTLSLTSWHMPEGWVSWSPQSISFTPDGRRCVVSTYNGSLLPPQRMIFTLDTTDPSQPVIVGRNGGWAFFDANQDEFLDVSPSGKNIVYHSNLFGLALMRFMDPDTNVVFLNELPTLSTSDQDFTPDGSRIYSVSMDDSISIFDFTQANELIYISGTNQVGVVNQELAAPLRLQVLNAVGLPVKGVPVSFSVSTGGGFFAAAGNSPDQVTVSDSDGYVEADWTLGPALATQTVNVHSNLLGSPHILTAIALADPNTLPLAFSEVLPTNNLANVSVTTSILATFSRAVDPATVTDNTFYLHENGETAHVPVVYGFTDNNNKVSLTPVQSLDYNTVYAIEIADGATGVKDANGGLLNLPVHSEFTTQNPPPLILSSVSPPSATVGVQLMLSGTGFDPVPANNTVLFNSVAATPTASGVDYITVTVPIDAVSGTISVQKGVVTSNTKPFTVIIPTYSPVDEVLATVGTGAATKSVVLNPDGTMAYTVSPEGDVVIPIDVENETSLPSIQVGDHPISIAMHPEGTFAYVPNFNSNSLSIICVDPDSSDYNEVRTTLIVGTNPIDVAVSSNGDQVVVANSGSNTLSIIDGDNQSASYHSVLATVGTGAATKSVILAPDGTRIYIGTDTGYIVMDANNYGVLATVGTGAATKSVTLNPDGTMLILLTSQGTVLIYNVDPNAGDDENTVLATIGKGSSTTSVTMNPDGTLLYLLQEDSDQAIVVSLEIIGSASVIDPAVEMPPFQVVPNYVDTIPTGKNPAAMAFDPSGSGLAIITNAGDKTVTFLNASSTPWDLLSADIVVYPRTLNLKSRGRWVTGHIELPYAYIPQDIDINTVLLQDTVPAEKDSWEIADSDLDGIMELIVKFDRALFQMVMPQGEYVPVTITGMAKDKAFLGEDTIRTIRPGVTHPSGVVIPPNEITMITWTSPAGYHVDSVDVYWTHDDGASWDRITHGIPNQGRLEWLTPNVSLDSCRVMVTLYDGGTVLGMGMSPLMFVIDETVAINLASFNATVENHAAFLQWHTTTERSVTGFHLLRSEIEKGIYERITKQEIPSKGDLRGGEYAYFDDSIRPNRTYFYKLEEINERGAGQTFGPFKLTYIAKFALEQNIPNPFNPTTTIHFTLPEDAYVSLVVYDVAGRTVRTLIDEKRRADNYKAEWNGRDTNGDPVASGVYFYRIKAGKHQATRKMVLLK